MRCIAMRRTSIVNANTGWVGGGRGEGRGDSFYSSCLSRQHETETITQSTCLSTALAALISLSTSPRLSEFVPHITLTGAYRSRPTGMSHKFPNFYFDNIISSFLIKTQ